ncbi:GGDEF domain-containing protein [Paenibacillus camerounensis]|uniref:GGDEF domain-containing protein n=1 Tax=Paenibacillus camerounensis TaxID=1243663 RepID=UPI001427CFFE|nr:diguanylate cyclase [Paenibacillus camerounensis]
MPPRTGWTRQFITPAFEQEYRLVLFDYVGSGNSDLSAYSTERYGNFRGYVQDLLDVIELLQLTDFIFIGHSVSSMIGMLASMNGRSLIMDGVAVIDCILVQMSKRIDYEQELMELNAVLAELSTTDKLTGLKNRRYFEEMLSEQLKLFRETGEPFSLLIIDIDHFKRINDTSGHQTGDYVLEKLGSLLRFHSREKDTAARYGGEEFVLILPDMAADEARLVAENLRLETQLAVWDTASLTVSIGIATSVDGDTGETLLHRADKALYASKEGGRNRVMHSLDFAPKL